MKRCQRSPDFSKIKRDIKKHARDINQWWDDLQDASIAEWALLIGIGCWGIPNKVAQVIAFTLSMIFFFNKLFLIDSNSNFTKTKKKIKREIINSYISDDERSILFKKLNDVERFRRIWNSWYVIKRNWKFIFGYTFLAGSFIYQVLFNKNFDYIVNIFILNKIEGV
ncbi:hypothetical protein [Xenorhabdus griffiniae]|uniref:Uncharacterized protein n=2 Tax=Xenorhabdus griffiniae TaxID=351672 RepID=A0ABY9XFD2_9GAMM|nr:hypothetical protein [Xenorhabdus griffiniae]MBD1229277.1 hypothetical protein [Xenorhabdus griffiniae]WMV71631.1 hypothetical protein QL128_16025 [Xenorhabdus griffiniae]WNH01308.1 hypothetical protein QL112_016030 [Xenorhabdus griffiniae]